MNPLHLRQSIRHDSTTTAYRIRFMTKAIQPAKSPPPRIVVPNDRYPLWGCVPSKRSRTPPCTISTESVNSAPIVNHHAKDLTSIRTEGHLAASNPRLTATLAEGHGAVKQTPDSLLPFRISLIAQQKPAHVRISTRDEGRWRRNRFHYRPSRGPVLLLLLS